MTFILLRILLPTSSSTLFMNKWSQPQGWKIKSSCIWAHFGVLLRVVLLRAKALKWYRASFLDFRWDRQPANRIIKHTTDLDNRNMLTVNFFFFLNLHFPFSHRTLMIFWWHRPSVQVMTRTWKSVSQEQVGQPWWTKTGVQLLIQLRAQSYCADVGRVSLVSHFSAQLFCVSAAITR